MGVYIPNIKKPKHCTECYFVCRDQCELQDNSYDYDTFKEQKKHCPLIEIDLVRCGECIYEYSCGHQINRHGLTLKLTCCEYGERRADERITE